MRFAFVHGEKAHHVVRRLCSVLQVTPSGYYAWAHRGPSAQQRDNDRLKVRIRAIHTASRGTYGSPRIHEQLRQDGVPVGRARVARLLQDMGLIGLPLKRHRCTTDSDHQRPVAPNVLARAFDAAHPNERWSTDITYVWTWEGWLYLAVVLARISHSSRRSGLRRWVWGSGRPDRTPAVVWTRATTCVWRQIGRVRTPCPKGPRAPCGRERMPPPGQLSGRAGRCAQTLSGRDEQIGVGRQLGQRHADAAHGDADVGADLEQPQP